MQPTEPKIINSSERLTKAYRNFRTISCDFFPQPKLIKIVTSDSDDTSLLWCEIYSDESSQTFCEGWGCWWAAYHHRAQGTAQCLSPDPHLQTKILKTVNILVKRGKEHNIFTTAHKLGRHLCQECQLMFSKQRKAHCFHHSTHGITILNHSGAAALASLIEI